MGAEWQYQVRIYLAEETGSRAAIGAKRARNGARSGTPSVGTNCRSKPERARCTGWHNPCRDTGARRFTRSCPRPTGAGFGTTEEHPQ
jgi:hypothetical protein